MDMEKKSLLINNGSASKKYALYQGDIEVAFAHYEHENMVTLLTTRFRGMKETIRLSRDEFETALNHFFSLLILHKLVIGKTDISSIGIRIVAPGTFFVRHTRINPDYIQALRDSVSRSPLHIVPVLKELDLISRTFPSVPVIGISDSAFHSSLPSVAYTYGLPKDVSAGLDVTRFGYHGISIASLMDKIKKINHGNIPEKVIICHLGGGVSVTALKNGISVDTSMGFTPLEGLVMATRVGDIDPGAILYLSSKLQKNPEEIADYLNTKCGLLGVSGVSSDVRDLLKSEVTGNTDAKLALDLFAYRVKKYLGSYMAVLGGVDMIVFSGTIGERSFPMRERILSGLLPLGIILDKDKNLTVDSVDSSIHSRETRVQIAVLCTDEMGQMAKIIQGTY
jgi:acetate kinase